MTVVLVPLLFPESTPRAGGDGVGGVSVAAGEGHADVQAQAATRPGGDQVEAVLAPPPDVTSSTSSSVPEPVAATEATSAAAPSATATTAPPPTTTTPPAPTTTAPPPPPPPPPPEPEPEPEPEASTANEQEGKASWYDHEPGICAHKTIAFGTVVRVTNTDNGRSTTCTVGDRGPFVEGWIIDLNPREFKQLAPLDEGVIPVRITW